MGYKKLLGIREFYKDLNKIPSKIKLISFIFIIYGISWGVIGPYFPIYLKQNLPTYSLVGLVHLILPLTILFLSAPVGRFCDVVGKKKLAIITLLFYCLLGPFYMISRTLIQFTATRIYHGILWSFFWIPAIGLIRDFSKKETIFAIGTFFGSYNFGTLIGASVLAPIMITFFPLRYIFLPLIFTNFLSFLLFLKIPEGIKSKEKFKLKDFYETGIKDFFKRKVSKTIAFTAFSLKFATVLVFMILFLLLEDIGANFFQIALFYTIATIPWVVQAYFAALAERFGRKNILFIGFLVCFVSLFLIFLIKNLILLFIFGIITSLGITMSSPILEGLVTKLGLRKEGEFTGVLEMIICLGAISGSLIGGLLSDMFYLNFPFLISALLCFISMILFQRVKLR